MIELPQYQRFHRNALYDLLISIGFLFFLSFLLRSLLLSVSGYTYYAGDEMFYRHTAKLFHNGIFKSTHFMPGWPFILSLPMSISKSVWLSRLLVIAIASFSTILVYLMGRQIFNEKTGFLAGLIHAFYLSLIHI